MIKKHYPWLIAIALAIGAIVAVAGAGNASAATPLPTNMFYPLTITATPQVSALGDSFAFKVTVTNSSTKLRFAPQVFLDHFATATAAPTPRVFASQSTDGPYTAARLGAVYSAQWQDVEPVWQVGLLKPGQSKTLVIWYDPTVHFPGGTDPNTGYTWPPTTAQIGYNYEPTFVLYDGYYKKYTYAYIAEGYNSSPGMK